MGLAAALPLTSAAQPDPANGEAAFSLDRDAAPDGMPLADCLPDAPRWLPGVPSDPADERCGVLVARLAALCDRRGRVAFAPDEPAARLTEPLRAAAAGLGWQSGHDVRRLLAALPPNRERRVKVRPWEADAAPGFQSDPAAVGLLRSDWGRAADALALCWPGDEVTLELRARGRRLFSGGWGLTVAVDGEPLDFAAGWFCVCHHADEDGGFLELQWSGDSAAGPVRVERQAFLSREGNFAVLSDAVRLSGGDGSVPVEHGMTLPVAASISAGVAPHDREARLFGGRKNWQRARIFPLAVPQFPDDLGAGSIRAGDGRLTLRHAARGGLVVPVVIDWNPDREEEPADWAPLTVTEDRRRLTAARAAAHRLRVGRKHQLLLCRRTDDGAAARAVLGHHHDRETLIAAFDRKGNVTPLLMV